MVSSHESLSGRVAVVTGSGRNIGRAIALELARAGAAVVINARSSSAEAEAVVDEIRRDGGRATVTLGDVSHPETAARLVGAAVGDFGRLDILVNNAGVRKETDFAISEAQIFPFLYVTTRNVPGLYTTLSHRKRYS